MLHQVKLIVNYLENSSTIASSNPILWSHISHPTQFFLSVLTPNSCRVFRMAGSGKKEKTRQWFSIGHMKTILQSNLCASLTKCLSPSWSAQGLADSYALHMLWTGHLWFAVPWVIVRMTFRAIPPILDSLPKPPPDESASAFTATFLAPMGSAALPKALVAMPWRCPSLLLRLPPHARIPWIGCAQRLACHSRPQVVKKTHGGKSNLCLVGGIPTPLKNMSSSVGKSIPNWMESHKIPWFQTTNQIKITIKPPFSHLCRFIAVQKGNLFPLLVKLSWKTLRGAPPCVMSFCFLDWWMMLKNGWLHPQ